MESDHFSLVENPFFEWEISRLGDIKELDEVLMHAMWAVARLADDCPLAPGSQSIRYLTWEPVIHNDGSVFRLVIYFNILGDQIVELVSIKAEAI